MPLPLWTFGLPVPVSPEEMVPVGARLRLFRQKVIGISQQALSEELDIDTRTLWRWETGRRIPRDAQRDKLDEFLERHGATLEQYGAIDWEEATEEKTHDRITALEERVAELEEWIKAFREQVGRVWS